MSYYIWFFMIEDDAHTLIYEDQETGTQWRLIEPGSGGLDLVARLDSATAAQDLADELNDLLEETSRSPDLFIYVITREPMDIFTIRDDEEDDPAIRYVIEGNCEWEIACDIEGFVSLDEDQINIDDYPALKAYALEMGYI